MAQRNVDHTIAATLLLAVVAGCGDGRPARVPVSGEVIIDGKPVTAGSVQLVPEHGRVAKGTIDSSGRFELFTFEPGDGCVPGKHTVTVFSLEVLNSTTQRWNVPKKYAQASTSDYTVQIDGPTDDLRIELTWNGGSPVIEKAYGE